MQASIDSLDTMVKVDTTTQNIEMNEPLTNNPAPDESIINFLNIPYKLEIQQEDNLSIDVIKLYQVCIISSSYFRYSHR